MLDAFKKSFDNISKDASKFHTKISSIDPESLLDPGNEFGLLWEVSESVDSCRACRHKFQPLIITKHHCRSCAGVFCQRCCEIVNEKRICVCCSRGETPSLDIQKLVRTKLERQEGSWSDKGTLQKIQEKLALKVQEALQNPDFKKSLSDDVTLRRGRGFSDDGRSSEKVLPVSGYFEFHNKTSSYCCIKLLIPGNVNLMEIPRPCYFAVPPSEYLYGFLNPELESHDLFILYDNPNVIPKDHAVVYDTRAPGVNIERISKCAAVNKFRKIDVYNIPSKARNVILKLNANNEVEPRLGNSLSRVGFIGMIQGRRFAKNKIDYNTNVTGVRKVLDFSVE